MTSFIVSDIVLYAGFTSLVESIKKLFDAGTPEYDATAIIIDFSALDKEKIYSEIYEKIKKKYNSYDINITLDIDVSD